MNLKYAGKRIYFLIIFLFSAPVLFAQTTSVSGKVVDAVTHRPIPFATVSFTGSAKSVYTDDQGNFAISSVTPYTHITASFVGYKDAHIAIAAGKQQVINIRLFSKLNQLKEVSVTSRKSARYRNKNNPAVELIRKVIENKERNRPQSYDYVEYKEYDRMLFALSNLPGRVSNNRFLRPYKFWLDNRDSTTIPGKSLLPIFLEEKLSQYYYRKNPEKEKTVTLGLKTLRYDQSDENDFVSQNIKHLYYKVDIYDNSIFLMTNDFLSPIANSAPTFYKYFITDTVVVNNTKLVELSFTPRNTADMLFDGKIYITLDGNYAVQKASLSINKNINLNLVKSMTVDQEFEQNPDGRYHLSKNTITAELGPDRNNRRGIYGIRTITYKNYVLNRPRPDSTYSGTQVVSEEAKHRSDQFWRENRLDTLSGAELRAYKNTDSLRNMPSYKRLYAVATVLFTGYSNLGAFEVGPINTFYSFNPVEGFVLRLGGRTTPEYNKRFFLETYGAYGFKDHRPQYFLSGTYSIDDKLVYKFPQNYIKATIQRTTSIPGQGLQFVGEDNVLLSLKHGANDIYLYDESYSLNYIKEYENHFSYSLGFSRLTQSPAGSLYFITTDNNNVPHNVTDLPTTEVSLGLRYAPQEELVQGRIFRGRIPSNKPVFYLDYTDGLKNMFGGQYNYQKLHARIDEQLHLSQFGWADMRFEAGHTFGQVPYPLLNIFHANQSYAFDVYAYNLMNFLEFVSDHYETLTIDQHFNGLFFNKIPLFKKLKWRETASLKAIYGGLSNENTPSLHPSLYPFPVTATGQPMIYALGNTPYIEGSVGIENIFKFVRIDLVRRFTYLDHPGIAKLGLRTAIQFYF
jgi:hypothetical protein